MGISLALAHDGKSKSEGEEEENPWQSALGGAKPRRLTAGHQHLHHWHSLLGFLCCPPSNNRDCFATAKAAASFVPASRLPNTNVNKTGIFSPYAGTYGRSPY